MNLFKRIIRNLYFRHVFKEEEFVSEVVVAILGDEYTGANPRVLVEQIDKRLGSSSLRAVVTHDREIPGNRWRIGFVSAIRRNDNA